MAILVKGHVELSSDVNGVIEAVRKRPAMYIFNGDTTIT
jgi:hypothetical protein